MESSSKATLAARQLRARQLGLPPLAPAYTTGPNAYGGGAGLVDHGNTSCCPSQRRLYYPRMGGDIPAPPTAASLSRPAAAAREKGVCPERNHR